MDFSEDKIRVNCLAPGTVETPGSYNHMRLVNLTLDQGRKLWGDNTLVKRQVNGCSVALIVCREF